MLNMRKLHFLFFVSLLFAGNLEILSVKQASLGGSGIAHDPIANPAALAQNITTTAFCSSEKLYGLKELPHHIVAIQGSALRFGMGAVWSNLGNSIYQESSGRVALGKQIKSNTSIGMAFNYHQNFIRDFNNLVEYSLDFGALFSADSNHNFGFVYEEIGLFSQNLHPRYGFGYCYETVNSALFVDWKKDVRYPLSFRIGNEWKWLDFLHLRWGYQSKPSRFGFGFGMIWRGFSIDYALRTHSILQPQHQFSFQIKPGNLW